MTNLTQVLDILQREKLNQEIQLQRQNVSLQQTSQIKMMEQQKQLQSISLLQTELLEQRSLNNQILQMSSGDKFIRIQNSIKQISLLKMNIGLLKQQIQVVRVELTSILHFKDIEIDFQKFQFATDTSKEPNICSRQILNIIENFLLEADSIKKSVLNIRNGLGCQFTPVQIFDQLSSAVSKLSSITVKQQEDIAIQLSHSTAVVGRIQEVLLKRRLDSRQQIEFMSQIISDFAGEIKVIRQNIKQDCQVSSNMDQVCDIVAKSLSMKENQLNLQQQLITRLQEENQNLLQQNNNLTQQMKGTDQQQNQIQALTEQIEDLKYTNEQLAKQTETLKQQHRMQYNELSQAYSELQMQLNAKQNEVAQLKQQNNELQEQLAQQLQPKPIEDDVQIVQQQYVDPDKIYQLQQECYQMKLLIGDIKHHFNIQLSDKIDYVDDSIASLQKLNTEHQKKLLLNCAEQFNEQIKMINEKMLEKADHLSKSLKINIQQNHFESDSQQQFNSEVFQVISVEIGEISGQLEQFFEFYDAEAQQFAQVIENMQLSDTIMTSVNHVLSSQAQKHEAQLNEINQQLLLIKQQIGDKNQTIHDQTIQIEELKSEIHSLQLNNQQIMQKHEEFQRQVENDSNICNKSIYIKDIQTVLSQIVQLKEQLDNCRLQVGFISSNNQIDQFVAKIVNLYENSSSTVQSQIKPLQCQMIQEINQLKQDVQNARVQLKNAIYVNSIDLPKIAEFLTQKSNKYFQTQKMKRQDIVDLRYALSSLKDYLLQQQLRFDMFIEKHVKQILDISSNYQINKNYSKQPSDMQILNDNEHIKHISEEFQHIQQIQQDLKTLRENYGQENDNILQKLNNGCNLILNSLNQLTISKLEVQDLKKQIQLLQEENHQLLSEIQNMKHSQYLLELQATDANDVQEKYNALLTEKLLLIKQISELQFTQQDLQDEIEKLKNNQQSINNNISIKSNNIDNSVLSQQLNQQDNSNVFAKSDGNNTNINNSLHSFLSNASQDKLKLLQSFLTNNSADTSFTKIEMSKFSLQQFKIIYKLSKHGENKILHSIDQLNEIRIHLFTDIYRQKLFKQIVSSIKKYNHEFQTVLIPSVQHKNDINVNSSAQFALNDEADNTFLVSNHVIRIYQQLEKVCQQKEGYIAGVLNLPVGDGTQQYSQCLRNYILTKYDYFIEKFLVETLQNDIEEIIQVFDGINLQKQLKHPFLSERDGVLDIKECLTRLLIVFALFNAKLINVSAQDDNLMVVFPEVKIQQHCFQALQVKK